MKHTQDGIADEKGTLEEMRALFPEDGAACDATAEIAERCRYATNACRYNAMPIMDFDQVLHIDTAEAVFHEELCGHTGSIHQSSCKCAVVPLLYPAAGTA